MKSGLFIKFFSTILIFCLMVVPVTVFGQLSDVERAKLEQELAVLQAEIAQKEKELAAQRANSASLSRDVTVLTQEINKAKLEITAKNKTLQQLTGQITEKNKTIETLDQKRTRQEASLAQILRKKNQIDEYTLAELLLSKKTLSGFLNEVDDLQSINREIQESFGTIKTTKQLTNQEREELEQKKTRENDVKYQLESQKKQVETTQAEKNRMLKVSKGEEKNYEAVIRDRQARATEIRARLFDLRGQQGIAFGDAVKYATEAGNKTGVRPALILAILTQESNLGKNVGQCNIGGASKTWRQSMPGPEEIASGRSRRNDQAAFLRITAKLGMNPDNTPISCPLASGGWGGAMGPSQFIPTTWEMYEKRVAAVVGVSIANPWNPLHAVTATSLYMADLGAGAKTYTAERNAACRYYSGRTCDTPGVSNAFYGNAVMNIATRLQADIDFLKEN